LAERGYDVVAISPDANHEKYFNGPGKADVAFHLSTFEAFDTESRFDVLFFSESLNYIDRDECLRQSRRLAKPDGSLLVSCTFRSPGGRPYPEGFELEELEFVQQAEREGFQLVQARDITENVLPTVQLAHRALSEYTEPIVGIAEAFVRTRGRLMRALLKWAMAGPRRSVAEALDRYQRETDPDYFQRYMRYATLVLRTTD
jgi:hypothetical protein